ncbi:acyl-CoA dehydrogenase family protein [Streptomyces sp. NBC_00503]|uniref:acyl-CoA dehydrogenase family protein n=1 Tax=Streptomyces sp. NBC_00503 TaxID=2903659 RepID=UPI002E805983|nr:acyl-CoA dehydrogenase family protein [Streptomyces sp. NBC_00503]WUD86389.1 acyl-CoA dehydrogenase family protein [Streptomyces sp. NBC_00503]
MATATPLAPAASLAHALPDAAEELAVTALRLAPIVEEHGRLTPELADAITRAGFARHFVPAHWGGTAGTFGAALTAVATVAETCASTAWCAGLYAAHGRLAAYLPHEGQADLWAAGPDVRIAAAVNPPAGVAHEVPGGWQLSGTWATASGVDHADWVLLASWTGSGPARAHRVFALPRTDCRVLDTWHTIGLRGTGSNSVTLQGVFVPAHRTMVLADLARPGGSGARCHAVPYAMVAAPQFAAPALGAARGALRAWTRRAAGRHRSDGQAVRGSDAAQRVLARSAAEIEAAGLLLRLAAQRADEAEPGAFTAAENMRDSVMAVDLCLTATGRLMQASGASGLAQDNPVQRGWRDVTAVAAHGALDPERAAAAYARAVFPQGQGSSA